MINTNRFHWKDNGFKLYYGKQSTGFSVGQSYDEPTMYHVVWPDKTYSEDYYNLTRAKDHCKSEASKHIEQAETVPGKAVDAFK